MKNPNKNSLTSPVNREKGTFPVPTRFGLQVHENVLDLSIAIFGEVANARCVLIDFP